MGEKKPYLFVSGTLTDGEGKPLSKEFSGERDVDVLADLANWAIEEYAKRKGPDDPARVIREE